MTPVLSDSGTTEGMLMAVTLLCCSLCPCAQRSQRFLLGISLAVKYPSVINLLAAQKPEKGLNLQILVLFLCSAVEVNTKCCQTQLVAGGCVSALQGAYVFTDCCSEIPPATPLQASSLRKVIPCCNAHNNNKIWISDRWILSQLAYGVL